VRLLEGLAELLAPTRCAGCELPGVLLCPRCEAVAVRFVAEQMCPSCAAPMGALVCTECWERSFAFEQALALGELAIPLARAVVLHKDAGERRLGSCLGTLLAGRVAASWSGWADAVTWVPATSKARQRRGFDHAEGLVAPVAHTLGVPALRLLDRTAARDQRALGRAERAANAAATFFAIGDIDARIIIVDDVFTTGATLDAAASTLLDAGADAVRVAVIARAW